MGYILIYDIEETPVEVRMTSSSAGLNFDQHLNDYLVAGGISVLSEPIGLDDSAVLTLMNASGGLWIDNNPDTTSQIDSNIDPLTGMSNLISLAAGMQLDSIDIGLINSAPQANAGTAYHITHGQSLFLDASMTTDVGIDDLTYAWDLDGDGVYDDAMGKTLDIFWDTLRQLGLMGGEYTIDLLVTDSANNMDFAFATLDVEQQSMLGQIAMSDVVGQLFDSATFLGIDEDDRAGYRIDSAGDVNGDGFDDILISASDADGTTVMPGEVYLVYGNESGLYGDYLLSDIQSGQLPGDVFHGKQLFGRVGISVASGDINGDGYSDILIGELSSGLTYTNDIYVVYGDLPGVKIEYGIEPSFGGVVFDVAGDIDGDGCDDIIIGAYGNRGSAYNSGQTFLVYGDETDLPPDVVPPLC